jgi:hypothetical protein
MSKGRKGDKGESQMRLFFTFVLVLAAGMMGCSGDGRVGVEGKVSYGGEPIGVGTITFVPTGGEGVKSGGLIENGAYHVDAKTGPSPGPHRVEIRWAKGTGKKSRNEFGEEIEARQEGLPEKYHAKSTLTAEINAGRNVIDFALEK